MSFFHYQTWLSSVMCVTFSLLPFLSLFQLVSPYGGSYSLGFGPPHRLIFIKLLVSGSGFTGFPTAQHVFTVRPYLPPAAPQQQPSAPAKMVSSYGLFELLFSVSRLFLVLAHHLEMSFLSPPNPSRPLQSISAYTWSAQPGLQ